MGKSTIEGPHVHHLEPDRSPKAETQEKFGWRKNSRSDIRANLLIDQNGRPGGTRDEFLRRTGVCISSLVESFDLVSPDDGVAA